jgi:hypothetical protein
VALLQWGDRSVPAPVLAAVGLGVGVVSYVAYLWALRADADLRALVALARRVLGR